MSITIGGGLGVQISGGIVVGPSVGVSLSGNDYATYLLRDDFTTAEAAPLTSPRSAEPGPGTLTITDTEEKFSIADGELAISGGKASPADGDPALWGQQLARVAGRTLVSTFTMTGGQFWQVGWDTNQAGAAIYGVNISSTAIRAITSALQNIGTIANDTAYTYAVGLRSTGCVIYIKGGAYTNWTLLWVGQSGTDANLYPAWANYNAVGTLDTFRVRDLPAPFDTDYGLATDRLAGAVSEGATFTHEANCVIEWTQTTLPSGGTQILRFRKQDNSNHWVVYMNSSGTLTLSEVISGAPTARGEAASVVSNNHRIVVVCDGSTIRVYSNNVLRITYSSASNFATATDGQLVSLGTGGAISDLVAWPRQLSGTAATILDQSVA